MGGLGGWFGGWVDRWVSGWLGGEMGCNNNSPKSPPPHRWSQSGPDELSRASFRNGFGSLFFVENRGK